MRTVHKISHVLRWLTLTLYWTSVTDASYHAGREFALAFPEHVVEYSTLRLGVTTAESRDVKVTVYCPLLPSLGQVSSSVHAGKSVFFTLPIAAMLHDSGVQPNGVLVLSDGDVTVQSFSENEFQLVSAGAFLALPVLTGDGQGRNFVVLSYVETESCFLAVVAAFPSTQVTVTLRLSLGVLMLDGVSYSSGDVIQRTLRAYEVLQLMTSGDLTGSQVTSSQSVSVIAGADGTKVGIVKSEDHMVEQLPPLEALGTEYVIVTFPNGTETDYVIVTATQNATSYNIGYISGFLRAVGDHELHVLDKDSLTTPVLLRSDKPVLAGQISRSRRAGTPVSPSYGDPALLILPPLEAGRDNLTLTVPSARLSYLAVVADSTCSPKLSLTPAILAASSQVAGTTGLMWSLSILEKGEHRLQGAENCVRFAAYVYFSAPGEGTVHPLYWNLPLIPSPSLPPITTTESSSTLTVVDSASTESFISASLTSLDVDSPSAVSFVSITPTSLDVVDSSSTVSTIAASPTSLDEVNSASTTSVMTASSTTLDMVNSTSTANVVAAPPTSPDLLSMSSGVPLSASEDFVSTTPLTATDWTALSVEGRVMTVADSPASSVAPPLSDTALQMSSSMPLSDAPVWQSSDVLSSVPEASRATVSTILTDVASDLLTTSLQLEGSMTSQKPPGSMSSQQPVGSTMTSPSSLCSCRCRMPAMTSRDEATHEAAKLRRSLAVNKSRLSSRRRQLESAPDRRRSAMSMGMTGLLVLAAVGLVIVLPDVVHVVVVVTGSCTRRKGQ